jgi:hypothetical protein
MRDYKLSIDLGAVSVSTPVLFDKPVGGRTIYKNTLTSSGSLHTAFIADAENHSNRNADVDAITASYEGKVIQYLEESSETNTYYYRFIMSEHVDGGEGNPEGSLLVKEVYKINNSFVTAEEFGENILQG